MFAQRQCAMSALARVAGARIGDVLASRTVLEILHVLFFPWINSRMAQHMAPAFLQ